MPVSNKVIVLDAGHGKPDEGAQSSNGTTEAETNLKIVVDIFVHFSDIILVGKCITDTFVESGFITLGV